MIENTYTPVPYVHREVIEEAIQEGKSGRVFYFQANGEVNSVDGAARSMEEISGRGIFVNLDPEFSIRIDRVITFFGIPGAAYDEYDALGRCSLDCTGGYPID